MRRRLQNVFGSRLKAAIVFCLVSGFSLAGSAAAQTSEAAASTQAIVPVVGTVDGIGGVRWSTEVDIVNDLGTKVNVWLLLPASGDALGMSTTLAPGKFLHFHDVIGEAFGLEHALSPLVVLTEGRRSVTVRARVYGVRGNETTVPESIIVSYGLPYYPQRSLQGLSFSEQYRTNIGLANLSESDPARFTLALQRIPGRNLAVTRMELPPSSVIHTSIQLMFPLITNGDDFTIVVETNNPETCAFASVVENSTNTARFVQPSIGAPTSP